MKTSFRSRLGGFGLLFGLALAVSAQAAHPPLAALSDADSGWAGPSHRSGKNRVEIFAGNVIGPEESISGDVVAVMGGNTVAGSVSRDVVAVMGGDTVSGSVGQNVVAVMGSISITGVVDKDVVAVMGNITLGPDAIVRGDVVSVGGVIHRAPGSSVHGRITSQPFGLVPHGDADWGPRNSWRYDPASAGWPAFSLFYHHWRWILIIFSLAIYLILALLFPTGVRRCGEVLAERPGVVILTMFLAPLALPVLFILLVITVVGLPLALVALPLGVLAGIWFGKTAIYGLIGRNLARERISPAGAVLLGGAVCAVLYLVPMLGFLASLCLSALGFGCVVATLLFAARPAVARAIPPDPQPQPPPPSPPPAPMPAPAPPVIVLPPGNAPAEPPPMAGTPPPIVPPPPSATLPRAGFWLRMGALLIDALIIGIFAHVWFLAIAVYAAVMWRLKGTTVGGIVFGLRVTRLDDRPLSWEAAIIRALGCFLSAAVLGLGFIWIAFDEEKQAWHDKLAGTVVVRTKGASLI